MFQLKYLFIYYFLVTIGNQKSDIHSTRYALAVFSALPQDVGQHTYLVICQLLRVSTKKAELSHF